MLTFSHIEHGSDQKSDHVVKKPVGLDVENEAAFALAPSGMQNGAAVVVALGGGSLDRERAKAVLAFDGKSRGLQTVKRERFLPDQLVGPAKRG